MNGATCGVAKFNHLLAQNLGVPCCSFNTASLYPLISLKCGEVERWPPDIVHRGPYDLFLHDYDLLAATLIQDATRVYAANTVIAAHVRQLRDDVITAFCPSTLNGNPHRADLNVLSFGMAHKLQLPYYEKLKALLDACGQDYTVSVSTAVHEGSPWDAVSEAGEKLRAIFKDKTRVLGYLADDALARELQDCSAVAMFFDPALRANNTTFWAAVEAQKVVVTNRDEDSPTTATLVFDITRLATWPDTSFQVLSYPPHHYTWDALLQTMGVSVQV